MKGSQARLRAGRSGRPIGAMREAHWREIWKVVGPADLRHRYPELFHLLEASPELKELFIARDVTGVRQKPPEPGL